jgi:hypothetical protein
MVLAAPAPLLTPPTSVLSLTQDTVNGIGSVPILTREPEIRGTKYIQMFIPKGVKGITKDDRVTLQEWLELVDWTGRSVSSHTQAPRMLKLHINPKGGLNQWITHKELKCGITRDDESAQSFADQRALELLANTISNLTPIEASKMELMSGCEVF